MNLCPICKGSGYPPGYVPPTKEEVAVWLASQADGGGVK